MEYLHSLLHCDAARMTRVGLGLLVTAGALLSAACDSDPQKSSKANGNPVKGEALFRGYCSGCHTLKAAQATGKVGPNFDKMKPSYARVVKQVTSPRFRPGTIVDRSMLTFFPGTFTKSDIRDIAAFVFISTHE
jgi:mono/diheme cytochrome c family protein